MSESFNPSDCLKFEKISLSMLYIHQDKHTVKARPEGEIKIVKTISSNIERAGFSFDKYAEIVGIVENNAQKYVRVTLYECYAGPNCRPCEGWSEMYFRITSDDVENISAENWRKHVHPKIAYYYAVGSYGTGEYIKALTMNIAHNQYIT